MDPTDSAHVVTDFDLAVIGGGPGGSACALSAARHGLRVVLFEPQRGGFDKPCGEGIMASGIDALRTLDLEHVVAQGQPFQTVRYLGRALAPVEVELPSPAVAIERRRLQSALDEAVRRAAGITRVASRAWPTPVPAGFSLASGGSETTARVLAVSDGLGGAAAPWLRGKRRRQVRTGLQTHFATAQPLECVEVYLLPGAEIYLTPLPAGVINAAVLVSARGVSGVGTEALFEQLLARCPRAQLRLGEPLRAPAARDLGFGPPKHVSGEATFLIGDAGGGVDPILGCGVAIALCTGIAAGGFAKRLLDGDADAERDYARFYRSEVVARRRIAWTLLQLSRHPSLVPAGLGVARLLPPLTRALGGIAAKNHAPLSVPLSG